MATARPPRTDFVYDEDGPEHIIIRERLFRTEDPDDRVVAEDDKDARWLYATPGTRISRSEAELMGIVKPRTIKKPNRAKKPGGTK